MNNGTILLVEDNPDDVALTMRAFRKSRITNPVVIARDGEEALDYLFARGPHTGRDIADLPAIILLDMNLPKADGTEVLRHIRADARTRFARVIMLTSSIETQDVIRSYACGANSYIRKPVDFDEFMTAIGRLGLYWLELNQNPPAVHEVLQ
ncbi:response regulator [Zavarzinella formosa]|uniref:response regulator n=1 Tax=Zavarzinella formosa TaxID=360055 RepID=UPI000309FFFF|nr:response regulator [Zavarzinella formosa]